MLVSVIIPLYNKEPYIKRALDSIFSQSFNDYEVIVVNDGSTDNGPKLVSTYSDSRLRLINQVNAGPGAARNRGIEEAEGEYVAFLDGDDEWLPKFLETSVNILQDYPNSALTTSAYYLGANKEDVSDLFLKRGIFEGEWEIINNISDDNLLHCIFAINSCSTVCRKKVLMKYGGFYSQNKCSYGEDYHLWLKIMFNCKIYRLLRPMWWYHIENSVLGIRNGSLPLHPFMEFPDDIRKYCPINKKNTLERWFALYALVMAHEYLSRDQLDKVDFLLKTFINRNSLYKISYYKLMFKYKFPLIKRCVHRLKNFYIKFL